MTPQKAIQILSRMIAILEQPVGAITMYEKIKQDK